MSRRVVAGVVVSAPAFSTSDATGDQLDNAAAHAYLVVQPPATPAVVDAIPVGDQFKNSWKTPLANPLAITSSTVSGSGTTGLIGPLQPSTRYQITVVNTDAGGSSSPSSAYPASSQAASTLPSAPTSVAASWTAPGLPGDMLVVTWAAATPGDSPIDQYRITITGSDGGRFTQSVSGTTLTASFSVSDIPDRTITMQAHNAAGWGPSSSQFVLGGA